MSRSDILRLRRQMHRRIREVVAERRLARLESGDAEPDPGSIAAESRSPQDDGFLVGG
ncbi:MAG TPA: hypothetical protein VFX60_12470 [Micromonospora sp.]|nr:hypothetical protein [Micromonospora sp.]